MSDNFAWIGTDGGPESLLLQAGIYVLAAGVVLLAAAVLWGIWWLVVKVVLRRKVNIVPSMVICVVISFVILYGYFILPSNIRDYKWRKTLDHCSQVAGYDSYLDNNNPNIFTFESQQAFNECIEEREKLQGT